MFIPVAIADDHQLVRKGLRLLLEDLKVFQIVAEASNGKELLEVLEKLPSAPALVLVDVNMPVMGGVETVKVLSKKYENLGIIALSVSTDLRVVREMIRAGANAYLNKDADPEVVKRILLEVNEKGFYYDQTVIESLKLPDEESITLGNYNEYSPEKIQELLKTLKERELEFIKICCTELPYKEIAKRMNVSFRTVDGYRESVFSKLDIHSRTGLVLFAVQTGLISSSTRNT